jgi:hypothetical protein
MEHFNQLLINIAKFSGMGFGFDLRIYNMRLRGEPCWEILKSLLTR